MNKSLIPLAVAGVVAIAFPASAHHSFAMFDNLKELTLVGTIREVQWTNPHVWVQVYVPDASGKPVEWSIEAGSPNMLGRRGWTPTSLKPGDKVTVKARPMKDGSPGGSLMTVSLNGKIIGQ